MVWGSSFVVEESCPRASFGLDAIVSGGLGAVGLGIGGGEGMDVFRFRIDKLSDVRRRQLLL